MNKKIWIVVGVAAILVIVLLANNRRDSKMIENLPGEDISINLYNNMEIKSSAFTNNDSIPNKYTCDGDNINPPLEFSGVPEDTKSLVLIMEDPDVPKNLRPDGMFDHWVVFNMDPALREIAEDSVPSGQIGKNTRGDNAYTGPCPPDREHRYFFKLFALNSMLELSIEATKADVEAAMEGKILDKAELVGRYDRQR